MKLLTLEEIEELERINDWRDIPSYEEQRQLLSTARAYWELKNDPKTAQETSYHYIGQLRQWLNECRITDPSKMVDNKDIMEWLGIHVPEGYRTDKDVISEALGIKEDKPHARTIEAVIEAFKAGMTSDVEFYFEANEAIKSLEKHRE